MSWVSARAGGGVFRTVFSCVLLARAGLGVDVESTWNDMEDGAS